eukprot:TRINITY_DN4232_c0_g1_i13.p1 TRINITY_DN4232_c0_g1~~TRINITY_DN4232_c0_g1_i13.p1  ORF type:complete len:183 (-),score=7.34 TRINITY_DN4232_c0_g1_i13:271-819(-)
MSVTKFFLPLTYMFLVSKFADAQGLCGLLRYGVDNQAPNVAIPIYTPNQAECQTACAEEPLCRYFTFNFKTFECEFKEEYSPFNNKKAITGKPGCCAESQVEPLYQPVVGQDCSALVEYGMNDQSVYIGIPFKAANHVECQRACGLADNCLYFTFEYQTFDCYFRQEQVLIPSAGSVSGVGC